MSLVEVRTLVNPALKKTPWSYNVYNILWYCVNGKKLDDCNKCQDGKDASFNCAYSFCLFFIPLSTTEKCTICMANKMHMARGFIEISAIIRRLCQSRIWLYWVWHKRHIISLCWEPTLRLVYFAMFKRVRLFVKDNVCTRDWNVNLLASDRPTESYSVSISIRICVPLESSQLPLNICNIKD